MKNLLIKELSRIFQIMGNNESILIAKSNILNEQSKKQIIELIDKNVSKWIDSNAEKALEKYLQKDARPFEQRLRSWISNLTSKTTLLDSEKKLMAQFISDGVKSSTQFRKMYIDTNFEKWYKLYNGKHKSKLESFIKVNFGENTYNEFSTKAKDMKSLEKNYAHIDPLKPNPIKTEVKNKGVTLSPDTETKIEYKINKTEYTNPTLVEEFFKSLGSNKSGDRGEVRNKIIKFFKDVFNSESISKKYVSYTKIFNESQLRQIEEMFNILEKKFSRKNIFYNNSASEKGYSEGSFEQFKKSLENDKLLVDDSGGTLKFSPLNKLDTNFNDNSRVLMDWASMLPDEELARFKVMTNMFSKGEISYSEYEKELNYVLNELKKNTSYPLKWFKNSEDRLSSWFTENIIKNTAKGNQSEEIIDKVLSENGLKSEINIPNVGNIKLTSMEGSPIDRLLNIDSIVQDTKGIFGNPNEFLTVQVKSSSVMFDAQNNIYKFYTKSPTISKQSMIDVVGLVNNDKYIIITKKNGKFIQTKSGISKDGKTIQISYVDPSQVKITNIK